MEKFTAHTGVVMPLDRANVDTDQIIPAVHLKRIERTGWGQFLFMGLIGVVIASLVGIFWHSDALQFVISVVGVLVFTGLTAWDAQRLKQMAVALPDGRVGAYAVVGALSLYLDFINLFFFLLRLMGGRRD